MDGTADRSGVLFDPLTLEREHIKKRESAHPQGRSLRPIVPKPPSPPLSPPCYADPMGPGARGLLALQLEVHGNARVLGELGHVHHRGAYRHSHDPAGGFTDVREGHPPIGVAAYSSISRWSRPWATTFSNSCRALSQSLRAK